MPLGSASRGGPGAGGAVVARRRGQRRDRGAAGRPGRCGAGARRSAPAGSRRCPPARARAARHASGRRRTPWPARAWAHRRRIGRAGAAGPEGKGAAAPGRREAPHAATREAAWWRKPRRPRPSTCPSPVPRFSSPRSRSMRRRSRAVATSPSGRGGRGQRREPALGRLVLALGPLGRQPLLRARPARPEVVVCRPHPGRRRSARPAGPPRPRARWRSATPRPGGPAPPPRPLRGQPRPGRQRPRAGRPRAGRAEDGGHVGQAQARDPVAEAGAVAGVGHRHPARVPSASARPICPGAIAGSVAIATSSGTPADARRAGSAALASGRWRRRAGWPARPRPGGRPACRAGRSTGAPPRPGVRPLRQAGIVHQPGPDRPALPEGRRDVLAHGPQQGVVVPGRLGDEAVREPARRPDPGRFSLHRRRLHALALARRQQAGPVRPAAARAGRRGRASRPAPAVVVEPPFPTRHRRPRPGASPHVA